MPRPSERQARLVLLIGAAAVFLLFVVVELSNLLGRPVLGAAAGTPIG